MPAQIFHGLNRKLAGDGSLQLLPGGEKFYNTDADEDDECRVQQVLFLRALIIGDPLIQTARQGWCSCRPTMAAIPSATSV